MHPQRITVRVRPGSGRNLVTPGPDFYTVYTVAPAERGKANQVVCKLLAKYFRVAPSEVVIVFGKTAREKLIQIG